VPVADRHVYFQGRGTLQVSWLNPDFATDQLALLAVIILACLIVLPVVFGGLIYLLLGLVARIQDWRRTKPDDVESGKDAPSTGQ
jgi:hypothetical protein